MTTLTALEVAGKACTLARIRPITGFTEGTTEAIVLNENYEDIVRNEIMEYSYKFCKFQWDATITAVAPLARWDSAFTIPADCLYIDTVTISDVPIQYDLYDGEIYCNATSTDTVVIDGTKRVDEAYWPSNFLMLIKYRLAEILADGVAQKPTMAKRFADKAEFYQMKASAKNSQGVTSKKFNVKRITNNRNGSRYET